MTSDPTSNPTDDPNKAPNEKPQEEPNKGVTSEQITKTFERLAARTREAFADIQTAFESATTAARPAVAALMRDNETRAAAAYAIGAALDCHDKQISAALSGLDAEQRAHIAAAASAVAAAASSPADTTEPPPTGGAGEARCKCLPSLCKCHSCPGGEAAR